MPVMANEERTRGVGDRAVHSGSSGRLDPVARAREIDGAVGGSGVKGRLPTLRQLAALLVGGVLRLPAGYRRGMFLDIIV